MVMLYLIALIGLGVVVFVHELGHFAGARLGGMRVKQLALGFGWRLFGLRRGETDYRINAIPLGGYVMVDGYTDADPSELKSDPRLMRNRPFWAQALYIISGSLFNLILAVALILAVICLKGLPAGRAVMVGSVTAASPAAVAGLQKDDILTAIDGKALWNQSDVATALQASGPTADITISRRGQTRHLTSRLEDGRLGIMVQERVTYSRANLTVFTAVRQAWSELYGMAGAIVQSLAMLFSGRAGLRELSGPVGMVTSVASTAAAGWHGFLLILAFISVNLGIFNILPIPALDGGKLLLLVLEKITKGRLSQTVQAVIHLAGFAAIFLLIALLSIKDVLALFH